MKHWIAGLATVGLLLAVLWASRTGSRNAPPAATPDICIQQMFAAAAAGDLDAYLACFGGEERTQMERKFAGQSRDAASAALRAAVAGMKGHAVHGSVPSASPPERLPEVIELPVERVYAHHNELQTYRLRHKGDRCQIESIRAAGNQLPRIPYGTPVF